MENLMCELGRERAGWPRQRSGDRSALGCAVGHRVHVYWHFELWTVFPGYTLH